MFFHYGVDGVNGFTLKLSDMVVQNYTYKKNLQGDIIGIYDSNNTLICKYLYDAWGNHKTLILTGNTYEELNSTNTSTNANIAMLNPFRYRGYYYDIETNLYYLNSRYYDPQTGRFINADDIGNIDTDNLNGLNLYMYCANNPVTNIDDNGNAWWNPFSWNWKKVGQVVATVAIAAVAVAAVVAVTVATAGIGTAIGTALGGGIAATIAGGAIGGAITGALTGAIVSGGISIISQGISNGYDNINWDKVGIDTLIGAGTGALSGAIFGAAGRAFGLLGKTKVAQRVIPNLKNSKTAFMFGSRSGSFTFARFGSGNGLFRLEASLAHGFHFHMGLINSTLRVPHTALLTGLWNSITAIATYFSLNK